MGEQGCDTEGLTWTSWVCEKNIYLTTLREDSSAQGRPWNPSAIYNAAAALGKTRVDIKKNFWNTFYFIFFYLRIDFLQFYNLPRF